MNASRLPLRAGAAFKPEHFAAINAAPQPIGFFEVHAENFMGAGGPPHAQLGKIREDYALSVHGVGLSIGSMQPLDRDHLARVKSRLRPLRAGELFRASRLVEPRRRLPERPLAAALYRGDAGAGRRAYRSGAGRSRPPDAARESRDLLQFEESTMPETAFLTEVAARTGCGLLLDVNNVFVAATNYNFDPRAYLADFPLRHVREIHLSGHSEHVDDAGAPLLIDFPRHAGQRPRLGALRRGPDRGPGRWQASSNGTATCPNGRCFGARPRPRKRSSTTPPPRRRVRTRHVHDHTKVASPTRCWTPIRRCPTD